MTSIGEIFPIPNGNECDVEWKIGDFFRLSEKLYQSPFFTFNAESWWIQMEPNGCNILGSVGYINLGLRRTSGPPVKVEISLALKTLNGIKDSEKRRVGTFDGFSGYMIHKIISRSELDRRKYEFLSSGFLTVTCKIKILNPTRSAGKKDTPICSYCKRTFVAQEDISSHQKKCMEKPIKCPDCSDVITLFNWYDHKCQAAEATDSKKVLDDFKEMMLSGNHSDTIIMVKGEEFRLHKNVLAARNPYFNAMFKYDMKEKNTGVVSIDDCEPEIFRSFIHFVYTGKVENMSCENVCGLYEAANKYQQDQLKENCFNFMVNRISVDNFCNWLVLALKYDEKKLLQEAIKLFASKTKEILRSVEWQNFVISYPIQANEIHIKALDFSDEK